VKKQRSEYLTDSDREALAAGLARMGFDPIAVVQMVKLAGLVRVAEVPAQARRNA
jgi:hypothetical protein